MMLLTVLCRFSVLFGKYFPKKTQHDSLYYLGSKWLKLLAAYVAAIKGSMCCYHLNSREKLIRVMLQGSGPAMPLSATCLLSLPLSLETKSVANFFHKRLRLRIILLLGNKVSLRNCFQIKENQNLLLKWQEAITQIAAVRGVV